ncbi:MAG: hypothetical protein ACTSVZ_09955 [Promethearchaeota archaeon]
MVDGKLDVDYENFVNKEPQLIMRISGDQLELFREHSIIFQALSKNRHMTAKEIHHLYYIPQTQKHSKSLKTIYRYLKALVDASLIQISGHRKPPQSQMTEKLCCRAALVMVPEENSKEKKWWESEDGSDFMAIFPTYLQKYFGIDNISSPQIDSILTTFLSIDNNNIQDQFTAIESDKSLADLITPLSVTHLKEILNITAVLKMIVENPDFLTSIRSILAKQ